MTLRAFFERRPAFWVALQLYLGLLISIGGHLWIAIFAFGLFAWPLRRRNQLVAVAILLAAAFMGGVRYRAPNLPSEGWKGRAEVEIVSVAPSRALFGKGWSYRGRIRSFVREGETAPCRAVKGVPVFLSLSKNRPLANCDYTIEGRLVPKRRGYALRGASHWEPIPGSHTLAEWRCSWRERTRRYLTARMESEAGFDLLTSLLVGEACDIMTRFDFGRLGLQHIMAISGFHFAIIGLSIGWILRLILPRRLAALALALVLTLYFAMVCEGAATQRAWVAAMVALFGVMIGRTPDGLNSLGLGAIGVLLWDPSALLSVGFQFSFAATAAILLFYQPMERWLARYISRFSLREVATMGLIDQHGALMLALLRRTVALTLAVHLVVLPLSLLFFHRFSILGLYYNTLFPMLLSTLILLLPWIALCDLVTGHGFGVADWIMERVVGMAYTAPPPLDFVIRTDWLSGWLVGGWLLLLAIIGMRQKEIAVLDPIRL